MNSSTLGILIYGAGAVGLGLANCLVKSGQAVTVISRRETAQAVQAKGIIRRGIFGDFVAAPGSFSISSHLKELPEKTFDYILVTTKSFDSRTAASELRNCPHIVKPGTKIVLCQNGWGNADIFREYFPAEKIFNARIITGFTRPEPEIVIITVHAEAMTIGSLFGENAETITPLCTALNNGDLPTQPTATIEKDLWAKMLYNCALNPLGAILNVPYGRLGESPATRTIMESIVREIFSLIPLTSHQTHWNNAEDYLNFFYSRSLPATKEHRSSTLQDIKAGKQTEIDALNGKIVLLAEQYKQPVPVNQTMTLLIKFLEGRTAPYIRKN